MTTQTTQNDPIINELFGVGAHYGLTRSRRHPSMKPMLYGTKGRTEIFDLEKTAAALNRAEEFVASLAKEGKKILFVGTKNEARAIIQSGAEKLGMPYVINRWIGGTITNFPEIKNRIIRLRELTEKKERGELGMYTKKERLLLDEEIERLQRNFGGLVDMDELPQVMFIVDPKKEAIAFSEARAAGMTVVALANSDCDISNIQFPIPGNDASQASIEYVVTRIVNAYRAAQGK